jgi:hypothetical protein
MSQKQKASLQQEYVSHKKSHKIHVVAFDYNARRWQK